MMKLRPALCSGLAAVLLIAAGPAEAFAGDKPILLPVPAISIFPGDKITAESLTERSFSEPYIRRIQSIDSKDVLVGKIARRTLLPGQPIPANAIDTAKVVLRGMPTQLTLVSSGLQITTMASPLESVAAGQTVQAKNIDTGVVVTGVAQVDGTIRIGKLGGS